MASLWKKPPVKITGIVQAGGRKVKVFLNNTTDSTALFALALCYAAKIRWLTLSEDDLVKDIFSNVYHRTVESWPKMPDIEMNAYLSEDQTIYSVDLRYDPKGAGWFVTNKIPLLIWQRGDIATHYFFLLRFICQYLSDSMVDKLGLALRSFSPALFGPNSEKTGLGGLKALNRAANDLIDLHAKGN